MRIRTKLYAAAALLVALAPPGARAGAPSYSYENIDVPGAGVSQAYSINNRGQIVGSYGASVDAILANEPLHGFLLSRGSYTTVDHPASDWTFVTSINDRGTMAGFQGRYRQGCCILSGNTHGWRRNGVPFVTVDHATLPNTFVTGINNLGWIVGFGVGGDGAGHGFLNDRGTHTAIEYPGCPSSFAVDVNDRGQVLVVACSEVRVWDGSFSEPIDFGIPASVSVSGLNNRGQIVGTYLMSGIDHAFVWDHGMVTTLDFPGADGTQGLGINDIGQVVGQYFLDGVHHAYVATP